MLYLFRSLRTTCIANRLKLQDFHTAIRATARSETNPWKRFAFDKKEGLPRHVEKRHVMAPGGPFMVKNDTSWWKTMNPAGR